MPILQPNTPQVFDIEDILRDLPCGDPVVIDENLVTSLKGVITPATR